MPLLLDTGAIYALADAGDAWHGPMRDFLAAQSELLLVPAGVIPEAAYLIRSRLGTRAEHKLALSLAHGELVAENAHRDDLARCADLMAKYEFLGWVDASIVAAAERLKLRRLVTTDRRDFRRVRPMHWPSLELLPERPPG